MIVKAMVTFESGFMTEKFVFGGTRDHCDNVDKMYVYQITSYLIDTGDQVILIDTSFPDHITELPTEHSLGVNIGKRTQTFEKALNGIGYQVEQVDKIIVTHNNMDHAGAISLFPNAEIIVSEKELHGINTSQNHKVTPVDLGKGQFANFKGAYTVAPNIHFVQAYGHSNGHGIVIVFDEKDKVYYMFSGDATICDDALINNEVLIVNENIDLAIETLNEIRTFIHKYPTIYLSTHEPAVIETLAKKRVQIL